MTRRLRIAIDCRITDSHQGVGTAMISLAKALSESDGAEQEYTFIVHESMRSWLAPYVYGPCGLEGIPESALSAVKVALRPIKPLRRIWRRLWNQFTPIPSSDGFVESRGFDIVHFPTQAAYLTTLPTIYQPHDLQHLHYPQFFSRAEYAHRERFYRAFCDRATYVCVQAEWTKRDLVSSYGIDEDKIVVIPWGSVFDAYIPPSQEEIRATIKKYDLPDIFFIYPAVTWPHKNHEAIFHALSILKDEYGILPHVVFTGSSTERRSTLDRMARELGISDQLHSLGFVTSTELQAIFQTATAMIFPSKFEGFGLPILEAFHAGLPVLSSNATTLPEVGRDAALYFDPDSPQELAALMKKILDTPELRRELAGRAARVLSLYSIDKIAASFQELYHRTAVASTLSSTVAAG